MKTTIKTASDLKFHVEQAGHDRYFFTRDAMKFFGDRMSNYGVRHQASGSAWFCAETFARVFPKRDPS